MELDTPDDKGVSLRAKLEKIVRDTFGEQVPQQLTDEIQPNPEDEILFDMFFEMYASEQSFHVVLDSYSRLWNVDFSGEDITLLHLLWREADHFNAKKIRAAQKKPQQDGKSKSPAQRPHRPSAGKPTRRR